MMKVSTKKIWINRIILIGFLLVFAYMLDTGFAFNGWKALIIFSLVVASFRIYSNWNSFKNVVDLGSNMIDAGVKINKEEKEKWKKQKDIVK
tara:strand:+ start:666 stop:941 length:276 start_codon:yes stop_codon:yes gene_type:complete